MERNTATELLGDFPPEDAARLVRYLKDELTPEEQGEVQRWIAATPDREAIVAQLIACWRAVPLRQTGTYDVEAALVRVKRPFGVEGRAVPTGMRPQIDRSQRTRWYAVTGIALGLLAIVGGWRAHVALGGFQAATPTIYTTTNGERANIVLPDGSTVMLNVASQLEVPANYVHGNHTVRLRGEGSFSIAHHNTHPFTVLAGAMTARVLGTRFVVRNYEADTVTSVAVQDGKVAVRVTAGHQTGQLAPDVQTVVLTADRQAELSRGMLLAVGPAARSRFAFMTGVLMFDRTPLAAAIPDLNRWYNADIRLGDPALAHQNIDGKFAAGSLAEFASILKLAFDIRVVRSGRVLTLYPNPR